MPTSNGVMYNATNRTLAEFAMYNCDIQVTKDSQQFLRTSANYSNIDLHNNIFYSSEGDKMDFYFISYKDNVVDNLKLTQNTFANVYNITSAAVQNPYINVSSVTNYTVENNLFYLERYNTYGNPTSWILLCTPTTSTINNNMLFKDINNQRLQVYKGGSYIYLIDEESEKRLESKMSGTTNTGSAIGNYNLRNNYPLLLLLNRLLEKNLNYLHRFLVTPLFHYFLLLRYCFLLLFLFYYFV